MKAALAAGVCLWIAAVSLTPGELVSARKRVPVAARPVLTFGAYLAAAVLVLAGLPRPSAPPPPPRS